MNILKLAILMAPINDTSRWFISVTAIDGPSSMTIERSFAYALNTAGVMWRDLVDLYEPRPEQVELWTVMATKHAIYQLDALDSHALFAHLANVPDDTINVSRRVLGLA